MPSDLYRSSPRPYPRKLQPLHYPEHVEVQRVSTNGGIKWIDQWVSVSHLLGGEYIGMEEVDGGIVDVDFGPVWLGRFIEAKPRIIDNQGRHKRRKDDTNSRAEW